MDLYAPPGNLRSRGRGTTVIIPVQRRADSTEPQTSNKDAARQIEAPHRVRLAKGEAGTLERPPASTLKEFSPRFESAIVTLCAEKAATVRFYQEKLRRLLADRQLCCARLNAIDEAVIDGYKQRRTPAVRAGLKQRQSGRFWCRRKWRRPRSATRRRRSPENGAER